jgi:hypothetical protein
VKCFNHTGADAIAVCSHCGKGLCVDCAREPANGRIVCSTACAEALARANRAMQMLFQQGRRNAQASAIYCFLGAVLSGAGAIVAWYMLPSPFLIIFAGGCALVLLLSGIWYARAAGKQQP